MFKRFFYFMFHLNIVFVFSQSALQNFGNIQIHNDGKVGFHINLINDGTFNMNEGLAGFYSSEGSLSVSGTQILQFHDIEIDIANSLNLDINTIVTNTLSYLNGHLKTPRDFPNISLDFSENSNYLFESDSRHTNGYVSKIGQNMFTFPIGDYGKIRPLSIPFQPISTNFNAAYFFEDPNFPSTFNTSFDTTQMDSYLNKISIEEFWDFNGENTTSVKLTWNSLSDIQNLTNNDLMNLRVVGWNNLNNQWEDLGNSNITGTTTQGSITSIGFTPNDYEVITFGSLIGADNLIINNGISPNNDGLNDTFVIKGIELLENSIKIYNRWGQIVFETSNYQNDWDGTSTNKKIILNKNGKLPVGTYFYFLNLPNENKKYSGWIYINY